MKEFCDEMDIPYIYIDPTSPDTHKFNPMEGNVEDVVEGTVIVLRGLFGKQDAFFANVQELAARNVTRLLKELKGDGVDLMEVLETLRDLKLLGPMNSGCVRGKRILFTPLRTSCSEAWRRNTNSLSSACAPSWRTSRATNY
ncbi:hypothetical protein [Virgibacillus sediminis]|uniref:Uncharacterized protein n=1 Tax=Virgibacillus sediminis TaxID=202260 RepID=A0ABV7AAY6_9BACI